MTTPANLPTTRPKVDLTALRTSQVLIIAFVVLAYILGAGNGGALIVGAVAISMAIGVVRPGHGPFQLLYKHAVIATGLVKPKIRQKDPAPHRFAQSVGASFLAVSTVFLIAGATTAGWILAWIVFTLALVNLVFGFCAGCFMFYQLHKSGLVS